MSPRPRGTTTLAIERLIPGCTYRVRGGVSGTAKADADGRALIEVDLDDLEVTLRPAPARSSKKAPAKASAGPAL